MKPCKRGPANVADELCRLIFSPAVIPSPHVCVAVILAALVAMSPINAFAQEKPAAKAPESTAAVWDLTNLSKSTLSDETIGALTQYIRVKVFNSLPNYRWLDRGSIKAVIDEQKFQASGCTDQSCVVELGQLLGARKMVTGSISKTGAIYNLTLSIIDIETGLIDKSVSEVCPDCNESQLYQLAENAVLGMAGKASQKSTGPDYEGPVLHKGRVNFDLNYPGAGLRYFFSGRTAVEARGQYMKQKSKYDTGVESLNTAALVLGARIYRYTSGSGSLRPYLCLEGDYISFEGAYSKGTGAAGGVFGGIEYFFGRSFSLQTDFGAAYTSIKDKDTALTDSGPDFIVNFGVNIYFNR